MMVPASSGCIPVISPEGRGVALPNWMNCCPDQHSGKKIEMDFPTTENRSAPIQFLSSLCGLKSCLTRSS